MYAHNTLNSRTRAGNAYYIEEINKFNVKWSGFSQKRKERGRIRIDTIHTVEQAQLGELSKQIPEGDGDKNPTYRYPFQVNLIQKEYTSKVCLII